MFNKLMITGIFFLIHQELEEIARAGATKIEKDFGLTTPTHSHHTYRIAGNFRIDLIFINEPNDEN